MPPAAVPVTLTAAERKRVIGGVIGGGASSMSGDAAALHWRQSRLHCARRKEGSADGCSAAGAAKPRLMT